MLALSLRAVAWWQALPLALLLFQLAISFSHANIYPIDAYDRNKCGPIGNNWEMWEKMYLARKPQRGGGGWTAERGNLPWMITTNPLHPFGANGTVCNGVIIDHNLFMTAASCVLQRRGRNIAVPDYYTQDELTYQWRSFKVPDDVFLHPNYTANADLSRPGYDVAVVKVNESFVYNQMVAPICLFDLQNQEDISHAYMCHFSGNGRYWRNRPEWAREIFEPRILPMAKIKDGYCRVPRHPDEACWVADKAANIQWKGSQPCDGEEGGPFVCSINTPDRFFLMGIHIRPTYTGCDDPEKPHNNYNVGFDVRANTDTMAWVIELALQPGINKRRRKGSRKRHGRRPRS